jgi:predicted transcriptional regulator
MMRKVDMHVGLDDAALKARMLAAIERAEAGETVSEAHVTFESWEGLSKVLTGKRLALLRHLRTTPAASIAELGRMLGRDYKRVYEDVEILATAGLIERTAQGGIRAAYDEIRTSIPLVPHAA